MNDAELRSLTVLLDEIVPPSEDGRLAGAGALDLAGAIAGLLEKTPALLPLIEGGLAALDELVRSRGAAQLAELSAEERSSLLEELAGKAPGFLPVLAMQTYAAYYQDGRVLEALGLEARPPHPLGYAIEENDLSLLDPVRKRGKLYRE